MTLKARSSTNTPDISRSHLSQGIELDMHFNIINQKKRNVSMYVLKDGSRDQSTNALK